MHRTEADNKIEVGGLNLYSDGPPGTIVDAVDKNTIQEELAYVIEQAGLTLKTVSTETNQQLKNAIDALILANSPNSPKVDFESKNLIINVQSNTTVDADADRLSLLNTSFVPAYIDNLNTTFNIATDLMAGTSEKASHWYQLWIDSGGTRLMVPDLEGTADGTTASKLVHSGATFLTDIIAVGDVVPIAFNITDGTQTTVTAIDGEGILSLAADIFASGEDYKIRILSPTGLGTAFKARIGAAFNNSGSNLDDSTYTQPQEEKSYSEADGDFTVTAANWTTDYAFASIRQVNDWTGLGSWKVNTNFVGTLGIAASGAITITFSGILFKNIGNYAQSFAVSANSAGYMHGRVDPGAATFDVIVEVNSTELRISMDVLLNKKPTFHN